MPVSPSALGAPLGLLLTASADAILILDPATGTILEANDRASEMYGFGPGELVGRNLHNFTEDAVTDMKVIEATLRDGHFGDLETVHFRRDGSRIYVLISAVVFEYEGQTAIFCINRDITQRVEAEEALRAETMLTSSILDSLADPFFVLDAEGHLVRWNRALEEISGYSGEQLDGIQALTLFDPEDARRVQAAIGEALEQGSALVEANLITKEGGRIPFEFSGSSYADGSSFHICGVGRNMTERREAEAALRFQRELLQGFYDTNPLMMGVVEIAGDDDVRAISYNRTTADFFGLDPSGESNQLASEIGVPDALIHIWLDAYREAIERGGPVTIEFGQPGPDGFRTIRSHVSYLGPSPEGRDRFAFTSEDITERRREREALQRQNALMGAQQEAAADGMLVIDEQGQLLSFNERFCEMWGVSCAEMRELEAPELLETLLPRLASPDDVWPIIRHLRSHRDATATHHLPLTSGQTFDAYTAPVEQDGHHFGRIWYFREITSELRMREELRESRDLYSEVVETVKDVVFRTDAEGRWTFLNTAWEETFGFSVEETLGKSFVDFLHPDDVERNQHYFAELLEGRKSFCRHEVRYRTKSGTYRWTEVYARLVVAEDGELLGTSGTLHDVHERREAMEALMRGLNQERELGELKSRFVSMASHELRTPLTAIKGAAELLDRFGEQWDADRRATLVGRIVRNVDLMDELIEDVLLLGRVDTGREPFRPQWTVISELAESMIAEVRQGVGRDHQISLQLQQDTIRGVVDPKLLRHIVVNLLSNAAKYAPPHTPVELRLERTDDLLRITVSDRGIGIPEKDLDHLFEPFHRASNSANHDGTGLGLTIVERAVQLHDGSITVQSTEGEGTTFTVELPQERERHVLA